MPESDLFYDLCDELGIMVMQEWPTCWDSQKDQPFDELEETVLVHMPRLRNHPSLIMWCGGNESARADGRAMDMMARCAYELDGSRDSTGLRRGVAPCTIIPRTGICRILM